ncbi:MAG: ABC transporter ATP-binding protein [Cytophagaceae bacterium]|nr:ABC transporter ATP-binding protein [Cytophagaceae bacterium]
MPVIEIKNVSKTFKTVKAVNELSLTINQGEFVALLGPNGAGKTTLIEMIEGIQSPDKGEIHIMGKTWKGHAHELHHLIGLSLQETKFIDKLNTEETLNLFGSFYNLPKSRTEEVLDMVNLQAKRKTFTVNLSGGQRQRLALGIALLNNPKILLLDEPTTGLDPGARRELWYILEKLKKEYNTTMILTTHYMEEAEYLCERILIMDKGRFIAEGTLNELTQKHGEGEIIEINLDKEINLSGISGIKKTNWEIPNQKGRIYVDNIAETLPALTAITSTQNIKILELECRRMTLDDLFISMTGRHLHE